MRSATSATSWSTSRRTRRCSCGSTAGRTRRARPQENFAREIMELFTMGVGTFTEADVYAGARVFTGWNLARPGVAADGSQHYEFVYNAGQHDTAAKTFSFPIYPDGSQHDPGADGRRRDAGRPRSDQRARRQPDHGALPRGQAVPLLRIGARRGQRRLRRARRVRVPAEPVRHEGRHARGAAVAGVLGPERVLRPLLVAGRVRRARAEGHRLGRASR